MLDTIEKWEYRAKAKVPGAKEYLEKRVSDCIQLPMKGLHGEVLKLTGLAELKEKTVALNSMYEATKTIRGTQDVILLDAWSSATIEGARTTVAQVVASASNPKTKDDKMVLNTIKGSNYAFKVPITEKNLRHLWKTVVADVCENEEHKGQLYRDGMVYIGDPSRTIHTPAKPEQLPEQMSSLFQYLQQAHEDTLIASFVAHFYFVYVHPFCDGNGRTARILNISQLYHGGYKKMKSLPLSSAINKQLSGYYGSLTDSEKVLYDNGTSWLDLTPFVSYMLDTFERCLIDAALVQNELTAQEKHLLERMNKTGSNAEFTVKNAQKVLKLSESSARRILGNLVEKGDLAVNTAQTPHIYHLQQNISV